MGGRGSRNKIYVNKFLPNLDVKTRKIEGLSSITAKITKIPTSCELSDPYLISLNLHHSPMRENLWGGCSLKNLKCLSKKSLPPCFATT